MREYAIPLAQDALKKLSAKYQFTPKGPILVEIFPHHDDFAVRNLGLPGLIGALGACFGRVVSIDSPRARAAWHVLLAGNAVARAGARHHAADVESARAAMAHGRGVGLRGGAGASRVGPRHGGAVRACAMEQGKVLKLQGSELRLHKARDDRPRLFRSVTARRSHREIEGRGGAAAAAADLWRRREGDAAIQKGLGITIDQLQTTFDASLDARFSSIRARSATSRRGASATSTRCGSPPGQARQLSRADGLRPGTGRAGGQGGVRAVGEGRRVDPGGDRRGEPPRDDGAAGREARRPTRAIAEYRASSRTITRTSLPPVNWATLAEKAGDERPSTLADERVVALDPFDAQSHTGLGRIALKRKDATLALREFKAALADRRGGQGLGPLRSRRERICSPGSRPRQSGKPRRRSRSRRASSVRRISCSSPSRARAVR